LRRFIGIILLTGEHKITKIKAMWKRDGMVVCRAAIVAFGRDRFFLMYKCFHFNDHTLEKLEAHVSLLLETLWKPASFAVVDESMIPYCLFYS